MSFIGFIFITLIMLVLVYVSFWLKMPQSSIPLFVIYIIFLISQFLSNSKNDSDTRFSNNRKSQVEKTEQDNENNDFKANNEKSITPKPLVLKNESKKKDSIEKRKDKKSKLNSVNEDNNKKREIDLELKNIQICRNISQRNPVGADVVFMNDVDSLYCYTRIKNLGPKSEVKHVWYFEDNIMTQVRYNVKKSNIYRSWTKKTILPNQVGSWRVDVQDYNGKIIGSKKFEIKRQSNQE